jgi:hypothetical protein
MELGLDRLYALAFLGIVILAVAAGAVLLNAESQRPILHTRTVAEPPAMCHEHNGLVECPAGVTWPPDMPP